MPTTQIAAQLTQKEWDAISQLALKTSKNRALTSFLVSKLNDKMIDADDSEKQQTPTKTPVKRKYFYINPILYKKVLFKARNKGMDPSTYFMMYVISPLIERIEAEK
jgi:hypothetical protein